MRIIGTIPHPDFKISLYSLDRFYYVEIEAGPMKQCYKFKKDVVDSPGDVETLMDEAFMQSVHAGFNTMYSQYKAALERQAGRPR